MKLTKQKLRKMIYEELNRLLKEGPFDELDAELEDFESPTDTSNYPSNEAEARAAVPKMFAAIKDVDPFEEMDIKSKWGLVKQTNDDFTFKTKDGGKVTVTVVGFRK